MRFPSLGLFLFTTLLTSEPADARPTESRRGDGMIRLPLKRLHNLERGDIHPQIVCDYFRPSAVGLKPAILALSTAC
jgi:hypothetical protein